MDTNTQGTTAESEKQEAVDNSQAQAVDSSQAQVEETSGIAAERAIARKAQKEAKELRDKLAALEGIDPQEYRTLKEQQKAAAEKQLEEKGEYRKLIEARDKAVAEAEAKAAAALEARNQAIAQAKIASAFTKAGGREEAVDHFLLVCPKLTLENGQVQPPTTLKADGSEMALDEWIAHIRDTDRLMAMYFKARNQAEGGGNVSAKDPKAAAGGVKYISVAEAPKHIDGLADGSVQVRG
jgi:hypothetical protein